MSPSASPTSVIRGGPDATPGGADPVRTLAVMQEQVDLLQTELNALRGELELYRRRDQALNGQMDRLDEELRLAAKLQRDFLPKTLPQVGNVRFNVLFRPAGYVSGDIYDVMRLDETHVGFYVADAIGHGMPAALLSMFLKRALITKEITQDGYRLLEPGETMRKLNEALVEQNLSQATFATALYGKINTRTLELQFARGGHPSPIVLGRDGALTELPATGGLLGIFSDETYDSGQTRLSSGDRLIIFSDGAELIFSDARDFDPQRWRLALQQRASMSTSELLHDLSDQINHTSGSLDARDDLTIVVAEAA